jgi:hypothetical protein
MSIDVRRRQDDDELRLLRALPLALGLGVCGWLALAVLAFGIYRLAH